MCVGAKIEVGGFFWINENDLIGFDKDAAHGNCTDYSTGCVDIGCLVTIRGVEGNYAVVRLDRPSMPHGSQAPIGAVFQIPVSVIKSWPEKLRLHRDHEAQRSKLASKYCV